MSTPILKTFAVEGFYTKTYGWEPVTHASTWDEAISLLRDYRTTEPNIQFRITGEIQQ